MKEYNSNCDSQFKCKERETVEKSLLYVSKNKYLTK